MGKNRLGQAKGDLAHRKCPQCDEEDAYVEWDSWNQNFRACVLIEIDKVMRATLRWSG